MSSLDKGNSIEGSNHTDVISQGSQVSGEKEGGGAKKMTHKKMTHKKMTHKKMTHKKKKRNVKKTKKLAHKKRH